MFPQSISETILRIIIMAPPILLALTVHEFSHGYVAYRMGDPTAKSMGRLSLNPLRHLDPIGTILFFLIHIGWARPVPVNAAYFRNPRKDMLWVALAGPVSNIVLAILSALAAKALLQVAGTVPSTVLNAVLVPLFGMLQASVWINIVLCIFNFIPIPPLDGSRILMGILPYEAARSLANFERYGFVLVLLLAATGILGRIINPIIYFAHSLLL